MINNNFIIHSFDKKFSKRILAFDFIRIMSCFLIVLIHSPLPSNSINGPFLTSLSFFTAPAIGLFFMISGALILPIKQSFSEFILKRLLKIGFPLLIWTIIYLALKIYFSQSELNLLQIAFSMPFSAQGTGVFWFIYTLFGIYFIAPILSSWLICAKKRDIEFILFLWLISLCYPLLKSFLIINDTSTGILYYVSGYSGYFLFGWYLKNYKTSFLIIFSLIIGFFGIFLILYLEASEIYYDFYSLFWYLSIFIAAWCIIYWEILIYFSSLILKLNYLPLIMAKIADLTFGIYLIHIIIMREWLWKTEFILNISNYYLQTFNIVVLTFFISLLSCFVLSKIPYLRSIIGLNSLPIKP